MQSRVLTSRGRFRQVLRVLSLLAAAAVLAAFVEAVSPASPAAAAGTTVVSLTFDDSTADQMQSVPILQSAGLAGTFYVISGSIGAPNYMTRDDLSVVAGAGNEIGGHTVNHLDLTTTDNDEDRRQVCADRATLLSWGYQATSFAYPYAAIDAGARSAVTSCGYNSARGLGDVQSRFGCSNCALAESLPKPADAYELKAPNQVDATWTLADLQKAVTNGEKNGGWVILTFHQVCADACSSIAVSTSLLRQFVDWLAGHIAQTPSTSVQTVGQVIGGAVKTVGSQPAAPTASAAASNGSLENLETTAAGGLPKCWQVAEWGTLTGAASVVKTAHAGSRAVQLKNTKYTDGAYQLLSRFDAGQCSPAATPGRSFQVTAWYQSTAAAQLVAYYRNSQGAYQYWASGEVRPASGSWVQTGWVTPALPADAVGFSFGIALVGVGSVTVDQLAYSDASSVKPVATSNLGLETAGFDGGAACFAVGRYGSNNGSAASSSDEHGGSRAVALSVSQYVDGAVQLVSAQDASGCSPAGSAGRAYQVSAWVKGSGPVQLVGYYRDGSGSFQYWGAGEVRSASGSWVQTGWVTPVLPAGATAVSFGLALVGVGKVVVDDFGFVDASTVKPAMSNAGLETPGFSGAAACWAPNQFGANSGTVSISTDSRSGSRAGTVKVTSYTDGGLGLFPQLDASSCAPAAVPGRSYTVSTYVKSTAASRFALYYRDAAGEWHYWTESPDVAAASKWTRAAFTTPAVPAGATAISFGLTLMGVGTLTTDDYGMS